MIRRLLRTLFAVLEELSDQTAYRRHLIAHQAAHSRGEWHRFCDHRMRAKYAQPKCC